MIDNQAFWNNIAEQWITKKSELLEWQRQERIIFASNFVPYSLILDLGCGYGKDVLFFNKLKLNTVGIDFSMKMLNNAPKSMCICGELTKLPFKDDVFDGIWSCSVLKYLSSNELNKCLNEAKRVLKKNGLFWIGLDEGVKERRYNVIDGHRTTIYLYTRQLFTKIANDAKFKVLQVDRFKGLKRNLINFLLCQK